MVNATTTSSAQLTAPTLTAGTATDSTIPFTWNDPNGGIDTGLVIEAKKTSDPDTEYDKIMVMSPNVLAYTVRGLYENSIGQDQLNPGTSYDIRAYFRGDTTHGDSPYSSVLTVTTTGTAQTALNTPTLSVGYLRSHGVMLNYTEVDYTNVRVEYKKSTDSVWTHYKHGRKSSNNIYVTGLDPATQYDFRMRLISGIPASYADSAWSATLQATTSAATTDMLMTVEIANDGDTFTFPFDGTNNLNFDYGDGNTDTGITAANPTHTYASAGTYLVAISGTATSMSFNTTNASASAVKGIDQMGNIALSNVNGLMQGTAAEYLYMQDIDLTNLTNLDYLVYYALSMYVVDARNLDLTNITSLVGTFGNTNSHVYNEGWTNTGNITTLYRLAYDFDHREFMIENIPDTSGVTNMQYMAYHTQLHYLDTIDLDVSAVTTMYGFARESANLESLFTQNWVTSANPNMESFARSSTSLVSEMNAAAFWGNAGIASHTNAFTGDTDVKNYASIPNNWKGILMTAPVLNAPTMGTTTADLTWTDPNPDAGGANENESGYEVSYSLAGADSWTIATTTAADVTSYQVTGLTSGTSYDFRVIAKGTANTDDSVASNIVTASTN